MDELTNNNTSEKKSGIRAKVAGLAEYMHKGCIGMIIISAVVSTFAVTALAGQCHPHFPLWLRMSASAVMVFLLAVLLFLVIRVLFKSKAMGSVFFIILLVSVVSVPAFIKGVNTTIQIILAVVTVLMLDCLGRCLWNLLRKRVCVPGVILLILSLAWVAAAGYFLMIPGVGKNYSSDYLASANDYVIKQQENYGYETEDNTQFIKSFSDSIQPGQYLAASFTYGDGEQYDLQSQPVDITTVEMPKAYKMWLLNTCFGTDFSAAPVSGKIWYPKGEKECPVMFIVHGAHDYTVPSHLGYDYLGEYLATHGYVVVSVDENMLNLCGGNNARAYLLLENVRRILELNSDPQSSIYGLIDSNNIVLAGHSRGGETVATAYLFNNFRCYPENAELRFDYNFMIKGIIAIAPTVDQYMPADRSVALRNVNYLIIHGSHDEDVTRTMGEKQYTNVSFGENMDHFKSLVYIYGANHGQFNDMWGLYDSALPFGAFYNVNNFIDSGEQKQILKVLTKNFLDVTLRKDATYKSLFYDIDSYSDCLPKTVYQQMYEDSTFVSLNNFEDNTDTKTSDDSSAVLEVDHAKRWKETARKTGLDGDRENHVLEINTREGGWCVLNIFIPETNLETGCFSMNIADMTEGREMEVDMLDIDVVMTDADGHKASATKLKPIYPSLKAELLKTDNLSGDCFYKHAFTTVLLDCRNFMGYGEFDMSRVKEISVIFKDNDRTIQVDDLGIYMDR